MEEAGMLKPKIPEALDQFLTNKLSGTVFSWQEIWNLMIPSVLDSLSIMFINTLITALISKNGESSVAAVSLMGPVTALIVNVFNGISAGGTVVVAQSCGRRDIREKKASISVTMWLTICIGCIVCIPMMLFSGSVIHTLYPHAETIVADKARVYLVGCLWSILIFTVYTAAFAVLRGLGESKRCLILSIIINVAYFVLSVFFLNFLKLDINGSVLALILARFIGAFFAVGMLFFWKPPQKMNLRELFSFNGKLAKSVLRVGVPLSVEQMFIALGNIVSGMYMTLLGTAAVATNAIANSLMGLLYSAPMSINGLTATIVGRCIGADKKDEAKLYGKRCCQLALILMVISSVVFFPLLPQLLKQYNPTPESAKMVSLLLHCSIPALLLFWPASYVIPNALRASHDTVFPSVMSLAVLWIVSIAMGYLLAIPAGLGLWGVWISLWTAWLVRAVGFSVRFRTRNWD